ncbi:MAG: peptidoglycan editing factor PgeF [Syntrophobacterales bacterium]|nr:peptidoglycan editing factor PgeF [Syntrophobacterales bacterium]
MFKFFKRNDVQYLECTALGKYDFITHAFCTRWGGISKGRFANLNFSVREGDKETNVAENWDILSNSFNIPVDHFFTVNQVHGDGILVIGNNHEDRHEKQGLDYDGIITNMPGLAIGVKTADCVPVFMVDKVRRVVGSIHAGWKGTSLRIVDKAVDAFINEFGSRIADITAVIGPSIGPCCYEVDKIVLESMRGYPEMGACFSKSERKQRWMLDLPKANQLQLIHAGIPPENILTTQICTSCHKETFFSHRGEGGQAGRQLSFIMLK